MPRRDQAPEVADEPDAPRDIYEMANLYPAETGLPMTVWVSPRGRARHGPRVQVCRRHGPRMVFDDTVSVSIETEPRIVAPSGKAGVLAGDAFASVRAWIGLNREALELYWLGEIDTVGLVRRLQRLAN